jgi:fructose-bisphosphate aldolase class II
VAVGNLQGGKAGVAHINLQCLAEIRKNVGSLLVLHGGTSLRADEVAAAVKGGVDKINYFTNLRRAYYCGLLEAISGDPENAEPLEAIDRSKLRVKEVIREKIRLFGCNGQAIVTRR